MGNCIFLGASEKEIRQAVKAMFTDPNHLRIEDPGQIEGNVVFTYLDAFHPDKALVAQLKAHYQAGGLGDGQTKKVLEECLQELIKPIRERRELFMSDKAQLIDILRQGSAQAHEESQQVVNAVKTAFGLKLF